MKNNKGKTNPVAKKSVQEIKSELADLTPVGGSVSTSTLVLAALNLNNKLDIADLVS